jgi:hypothetical protein
VLNTLGIKHVIQQGSSFIVGVNVIGDPLGAIAWQYDIVLPTNYFDTKESRLTIKIDELFGPCWCNARVLYDDDVFASKGFLELDINTLLDVDDMQTVLEL